MVPPPLKSEPPIAVAIMGATATGKTDVSIRLAQDLDGEIISMDSRQVYRGFDIGTAKVMPREQSGIPHHLIDTLDPQEKNTAGLHVGEARRLMDDITGRGKLPVLAGGTGLYFRAVFRGLLDLGSADAGVSTQRVVLATMSTEWLYDRLREVDPDRASELSPNDRSRLIRALEIHHATGRKPSDLYAEQDATPKWRGPKVVLTWQRDELRRRIAERTREMFGAGWIDEVRSILKSRSAALTDPAMKSIGYDLIGSAIVGKQDPMAELDAVITATQQYAKRQETFFRSEKDARWFDMSEPDVYDAILAHVRENLV